MLLPNVSNIDPDLFWDTDGTVYTSTTGARFDPVPGIQTGSLDLSTGLPGDFTRVWNGTTGVSPEGPHNYNINGTYYLLIAEGGTEIGHRASMARSTGNLTGPFESDPSNPILTAVSTTKLFQSVGHCDIFQDFSTERNWWAACLARRSGPEYKYFPMSRETVLAPCSWTAEGWLICDPVLGNMTGPLPQSDRSVPGDGKFFDEGDNYTFPPRSSIPTNFIFYGMPNYTTYTVSSDGHENTLRIAAQLNDTVPGLSFVGRKQTDTLFTFSAQVEFAPESSGDEAGITVFQSPSNRLDLGITLAAVGASGDGASGAAAANASSLAIRFSVRNGTSPANVSNVPDPIYMPISSGAGVAHLRIRAVNTSYYSFSAGESASNMTLLGYAESSFVSADFTGASSLRSLSLKEHVREHPPLSVSISWWAGAENAYPSVLIFVWDRKHSRHLCKRF